MLIWVLVATTVVTGSLFAGMQALRATTTEAEAGFRAQGQAVDVARAGVVDAYAWFRRQTSQPVASFAPRRDLTTTPPTNETDDATIGLVRQFEISPSYYGRYEVRRWADTDGDGIREPGEGVYDVTGNRALTGSGTTWHIESRGFVFHRVNPAVAWNVFPNQRVAGAVVATEIRRVTLVPPGAAALSCSRGSNVTIGANGRVDGDTSAGVVYPPSTGTPAVSGQIAGVPTSGGVPGYSATWLSVFGLAGPDLKALATINIASPQTAPSPFPDYSLVYCEGSLTVTPAAPLHGVGILVVNGDLTIQANTNSYFTGFIYVTGNYSQAAPSIVRGAVVVLGTANVTGSSDFAEIDYDAGLLAKLVQQIGSYRVSRAMHRLDKDVIGGIR